VASCKKHLIGHRGTVLFTVGTMAAEPDRSVNAREFDVSSQVVFDGMVAHDEYQNAEWHLAFIAEGKGSGDSVQYRSNTTSRYHD
jgi:hypothetical protein